MGLRAPEYKGNVVLIWLPVQTANGAAGPAPLGADQCEDNRRGGDVFQVPVPALSGHLCASVGWSAFDP
jgi:hypothetical protein